ncbi:TetR/AcrR family transcriptional regulator [Amycolatopsis cihanbeyliensis]|nr:helix-turn-helix domain-containing protein [Amycolatopsis cihanbeyliensis]
MDVAEEHLVRLGYRAVSLQRVAREVGVAKPALYYHFPQGKEELVVAILHHSLVRVRAGLTRAMAAATAPMGRAGCARPHGGSAPSPAVAGGWRRCTTRFVLSISATMSR